ncbi:MAG: acetate--CoA ligase family protein [Synergistaceae bacterium]|nr:acetate--CoA ligase family protein [Synergistaceae bacterium]
MIAPIWNPVRGTLRVAGLASGSGNTLWKALELQRELEGTWEGSPFEIVAVFADSPDSKCVKTAGDLGIPCESSDIRAFYAERGAELKDRGVRADYDRLILSRLAKYRPDMLLLAGYVWATTDVITKSILTAGVHPADLSIMKDGRRAYAGARGIESTLAGGEPEIRASSYLATPVIDGGPILMISPPVKVDAGDNLDDRERSRRYLAPVNDQGRIVGTRTVLEIAQGHFGMDGDGCLYYKGIPVPSGVKFESWDENRPLHTRSIAGLLSPGSIAVVGASARGGLGGSVLKNIVDYGFKGRVWAVNRGGEDVLGVKGYQSVSDLPEVPDLALITVPGEAVEGIAEECGKKGVKALVVLSAGFREIGGSGADLERRLVGTVNRYNMRMLGPNGMGIINTSETASLNANMIEITPRKGGVSFITQSGAIGSALTDFAEEMGIGFSIVASTGNQPDVTVNDLIPFMAEDENTSVIIAYLETIPDPGRFARIVKKAAAKKPVVILKSGRTAAGARAASSHTGSLAGDSAIVESLIEKTGAIRAKNIEEMFLLAAALSKMPRFTGGRVGVISNAGGPGTLIADSLSEAGFTLPMMSQEMRDDLARSVMSQASTGNPIDLVATALPEHYAAAAARMIRSGIYDALILMVVPPVGVPTAPIAGAVAETLKSSGLPVVSCFFGPSTGEGGRRAMLDSGIPSFEYPEQTVEALALMRRSPREEEPFEEDVPLLDKMYEIRGLASGDGYLPQDACQRLLSIYGLPAARSALLRGAGDCDGLDLTYPLAAKIDHPDIVHKSDVGGVVLNIGNQSELKDVVQTLLGKFSGARGVLAQEQARPGLELILGANSDPDMGHVMLVGMGGVSVEIDKDIATAHVPFDRGRADAMLRSLRAWRLLEGCRGRAGVDVSALKDLMRRLQRLLLDNPNIKELDLNPVIWDGERFVIADFRIRV